MMAIAALKNHDVYWNKNHHDVVDADLEKFVFPKIKQASESGLYQLTLFKDGMPSYINDEFIGSGCCDRTLEICEERKKLFIEKLKQLGYHIAYYNTWLLIDWGRKE